jgi:glycosyltransferase involved in cell wall biosynthesis
MSVREENLPILAGNGRPLRVLHIGNIANNAYNNAKLQRRVGIHADVLCYNYFHIMGCPEWEDADFDAPIANQFHPEWHKIDLHGFERPEWFVQGDIASCVAYLVARQQGQRLRAWVQRQRLELTRRVMCKFRFGNRAELALRFTSASITLPGRILDAVSAYLGTRWGLSIFRRTRGRMAVAVLVLPLYYGLSTCLWTLLLILALVVEGWRAGGYVLGGIRNAIAGWFRPAWRTPGAAFAERCAQLAREWAELFPQREPLRIEEMDRLLFGWRQFSRLLPHYDLVQAYATDPIWPLLCDYKPYVAYEHGTLRNLPEERSLMAQLTALAYRKSTNAFITNGDCLRPAEQLGVPRRTPCLHGIDDSKIAPHAQLRAELLRLHQVDHLYVCPLRHNWMVKGTDQYIRALPEIVRQAGPRFRVFMMNWGEQVEDSRQLARVLGVASYIIWKEPVPHPVLIRWYGAADCVFDQIAYPHFGATAPEAMGCGTPVIMSYRPEATAWIIRAPAPILSAWSVEDVIRHVVALRDPAYHAQVSQRSREWFLRHHTSQRILDDHLAVYREALQGRADLRQVA